MLYLDTIMTPIYPTYLVIISELIRNMDMKYGRRVWINIYRRLKNLSGYLRKEKIHQGHKKITGKLVFDIKMYITHEVWFVEGGRLTYPPQALMYYIVLLWDRVHIIQTIVYLNDLNMRFFYIGNDNINS